MLLTYKRLMGKSLLSMTRLQNVFHFSVGKKIFWGVVYQQCHEGGLFLPFKSGWICMCALHDNSNHASQEISWACAPVIPACKFEIRKAGTEGACGILRLTVSQPLCCVRGVSGTAERGIFAKIKPTWADADALSFIVILWNTQTEECQKFREWL